MKFAIPTYARFDTLNKKTLSYLDKHKIPHEKIYIFIRNGDPDFDKYKELKNLEYNVVTCDSVGAGMKHNFITTYFEEGEFIIELDDDIKDLIDEYKKSITDFTDKLDEMIDIMTLENINYGGIYSCDNAFFMLNSEKYTRDLRYMLGVLRIRRICKDVIVKTNFAEDFEFCLRHFVRDGKILKNNHIGPKTSLYAKGGNKSAGRNNETEKIDKELVNSEFPELSKLFQRKNGKWDLRIKSYKSKKKISHKV
tara:strand:- start:3051 stop:3806 length:756 start_codon:yes stop_codon:yes gene_type:complete